MDAIRTAPADFAIEPSVADIVAASVSNAEALRDYRADPARALHDANECALAFQGFDVGQLNDPSFVPAQMLNVVVVRWARNYGTDRGDLWGNVARELIRLTRDCAKRRG